MRDKPYTGPPGLSDDAYNNGPGPRAAPEPPSSLEATMKQIQNEEATHYQNHALAVMRNLLAGALCAECGEPLGTEGEVEQDDDGRTLHEACLESLDKPEKGT